MLPPFNDDGNLPPGIHLGSIDEIIMRFGSGSEEREAEMSELLEFIQTARQAGVRRMLINGSFATGKLSPNDVDVVILPGIEYPKNSKPVDSSDWIWPYLQIIVAADDQDFEAWATHQFATDRRKRPKGVVEVIL